VARKAVEELKKTTAAQLWMKDLDEFEVAWEKMKEVRAGSVASAGDKVKASTKKTVSKSKKVTSIAAGGS
jgi:hypothetical protein